MKNIALQPNNLPPPCETMPWLPPCGGGEDIQVPIDSFEWVGLAIIVSLLIYAFYAKKHKK